MNEFKGLGGSAVEPGVVTMETADGPQWGSTYTVLFKPYGAHWLVYRCFFISFQVATLFYFEK